METYGIGLVPGPVSVPPELLAPYRKDYGSSDLEEEFFTLYQACEARLGTLLGTSNRVIIQSGEGMLALWGALKSVLRPGDRVLAVANGVFGYGIADMARQLGMTVDVVGFGYDEVPDPDKVRDEARRLRPLLLTAVHCETPSGTLSELAALGDICAEVGALLYVDFVSSVGGGEMRVEAWHIDLGLLGSQKVLSLPPDLAMVTVSERAWEAVKDVGYVGYDALAAWRTGVADRYLPYTHNWRAVAALDLAAKRLLDEGLPAVFRRHADVAALCRGRLRAMGENGGGTKSGGGKDGDDSAAGGSSHGGIDHDLARNGLTKVIAAGCQDLAVLVADVVERPSKSMAEHHRFGFHFPF